ncbi:transcriptional regulator [Pseudodesulfovibrio nedwellii]|uniref:Transcriptional regulator n=1 Tax=Pseudodesulfovibrio nedwellii TaxID=2973072 RepID=A0ABM8B111_9BACT|nr:MarR family transcriptional regulator [Pseudodesulfovibrio nedwellii]BDQ37238.1 transcriptional regulator [Pseudodesulfovibrio nedwellii]
MTRRIKYNLENSTGSLLNRASQLLRLGLNRKISDARCCATAEQWKILTNLSQTNGMTQQELAEKSFKSKASMTKMIDRLESRKLVTRQPAPEDRRYNRIHLSSKGSIELKALMPLAQLNLTQAEQGLSKKELNTFKIVLKKIIVNMENNYGYK